MKKKLVALFLLAALLLSACAAPAPAAPTAPTDTEQASMPGRDAQNGFGMPGFSFQKIGSNYCGSNALGSYLYYYDTATGTSGPLCAKPDCTHDTKDCFAYTGQGASLSYYDGKLYWIGQMIPPQVIRLFGEATRTALTGSKSKSFLCRT